MRLSEHFSLTEACKSQTADRLGIDNTPSAAVIDRMKAVCEKILEPVRAHYNLPVTISSFYRSPRLNAEIGSKPTSQHTTGEAVDFEIPGIPNPELAAWVRDNLVADQIILEFHTAGIADSGWVHVSYRADETACRQECLTINKQGVFAGLVEWHPFS